MSESRNKHNLHSLAANGNKAPEFLGAKVDKSTTTAFFMGVIAAFAVTGGVAGINHLNTPRVIDTTSVNVENGNKPGPAVCDAVAELAEKHGHVADKDQCNYDLKDTILPNGTPVTINFLRQPLFITNEGFTLNAPFIETSIDDQRKK